VAQFLTTRASGIVACDFVQIKTVRTGSAVCAVVVEHATRVVHVFGVSAHGRDVGRPSP
jgi:hypothetical protein